MLFSTDFTGHNGARRAGEVEAEVAGCAPTAKAKIRKAKSKHPRVKVTVKGDGSTLRKVNVKLPPHLKVFKKKAFKRGAKAKGDDGKIRKSKLRRTRRRVKVNVADTGTENLKLNLRKRALKRTKKIKKGKELKFKVKVVDAGGFKTKLKPRARAR